MRILLFAYYFPPMGGIGSLRALGFARHLPSFGPEVTVIAPRTGTYGRDPSLSGPTVARVVRTGTLEPSVLLGRADRVPPPPGAGPPPPRRGRSALRGLFRRLVEVPDGNAGWVPAAVSAGLREGRERRPDVILSSSPPLSAHLAASLAARRLRVPHVADFRDFADTQLLFGGLRGRLDRRIEAGVIRRLAGVVTATEGVLADLTPRTGAPGLVVPNGFDDEDFAGPAPPVPPAPPLTLVHVGSSYAAHRPPDEFLGAIRDLDAAGTRIRLRFLGAPDGPLAGAVDRAGVRDLVSFEGFATHAEAVREMRAAPALLLFVWGREGRIDRGILAGKTLEYLRAGRPVLVIGPEDGETARTVAAVGGGRQVEIGDREGIRAELSRLAAGDVPAPADPARLAPWSRRAQAERLAKWLEDLLGFRR